MLCVAICGACLLWLLCRAVRIAIPALSPASSPALALLHTRLHMQPVVLAPCMRRPRSPARSTARQPTAGYKGSSDLYIDANIQLAIAAGKQVRAAAAAPHAAPPCSRAGRGCLHQAAPAALLAGLLHMPILQTGDGSACNLLVLFSWPSQSAAVRGDGEAGAPAAAGRGGIQARGGHVSGRACSASCLCWLGACHACGCELAGFDVEAAHPGCRSACAAAVRLAALCCRRVRRAGP